MGSLKSVENISGIDYLEYRHNLYWNKFKFKAKIYVPLAYLVNHRLTLSKKIDVEFYKNEHKTQAKYTNLIVFLENNENFIENLKKLKKEIKQKGDCSIRAEGNYLSVFSDDLNKLHQISSWGKNIQVSFTQVEKNPTDNGIKYYKKEPKHKYRMYLQGKRVNVEDLIALTQTVTLYSLCPSKSLSKCLLRLENLSTSYRIREFYISPLYFIEYDDESMSTVLSLMHGELLGKKYKLEKAP